MNDANSQIVKMIRNKYNELEYLLNNALKNLEKQLEQIISRLVEYDAIPHDFQYESFPYELLKQQFDKIQSQIQMNMQLDIGQLFMSKSNKILHENQKFESVQLLLFNTNIQIQPCFILNHYVFSLVGNPIQQNNQSSIQLKIDKLVGDLGIGICDLEIMKSHKFRPVLNNVGSGAYVLFQDKYVIHSDNPILNWKVFGLRLVENDKIQINYFPDTKKIQWINVNTQEKYEYSIRNIERQFHFCVANSSADNVVSIIQ